MRDAMRGTEIVVRRLSLACCSCTRISLLSHSPSAADGPCVRVLQSLQLLCPSRDSMRVSRSSDVATHSSSTRASFSLFCSYSHACLRRPRGDGRFPLCRATRLPKSQQEHAGERVAQDAASTGARDPVKGDGSVRATLLCLPFAYAFPTPTGRRAPVTPCVRRL